MRLTRILGVYTPFLGYSQSAQQKLIKLISFVQMWKTETGQDVRTHRLIWAPMVILKRQSYKIMFVLYLKWKYLNTLIEKKNKKTYKNVQKSDIKINKRKKMLPAW